MYATRYPRNHLSSRFRPSVWKTPRNRTPQPQDALRMYETLLRARETMKPAPANVCHRIFLDRARVSNPPDCPATRLRLGPRRDRVAKRPDSGRTTAWANVEGRHLLCGFVGRLQLRSPHLPRKACPHRARRPFLGPLPGGQNRWGTKAEKWYPAPPIRVLPYLETPGTTKRAPIELGSGGVTTGRGAQLGAPYTSAP